ncbi:hypothetical protein Cfor_02425 [Coptotermes formosanus]|jgi:gamma-aminobutyric acid type B receptor|uniref:Receptor ligand binding region domain-containing protein n=1 Tax=Coptotermes formosanus TaxID=36987 RepID=A0A6L2PSB8_COPFO|nr:hypothetical protein Cfor_02425 [Coptotermes formosanus]
MIQTYVVAVLQLSYADTHPMFTKQNFPNFFRVVPSENAFNAPRLKLLQEYNWTRVGTIYQNEPRYSLVSCDVVILWQSKIAVVLKAVLLDAPQKPASFTRL